MDELLTLPLDELLARARAVRDAAHGTRVTFSPKVFIPLTMLCRDRCGYCTFAQPPARLENPFLTAEQVLRIARDGARMGCHEALFTLGEAPEERYAVAREWLTENGYDSTVHYLHAMAGLVLRETGLLPHANAGALPEAELRLLAEVSPSQGMMIETLRADLPCHRGAPDKTPQRRLDTLEAAGRASVRALQFVMSLFVAAGLAGVALHFQSTLEFQREIDPSLAGFGLVLKALQAKAPPALAPGVMVQLGLLGLAFAYRHPALGAGKGLNHTNGE